VLLALSLPWSTSLVGIFGVVLHGYAEARAEGPGLAEAPDPRDADRVVRSGVCRNPVVLLDLLLFPADDLANWIGLLAGVQNASTSRFNSHPRRPDGCAGRHVADDMMLPDPAAKFGNIPELPGRDR